MKVFDFERAYKLVMACTKIFGREWFSAERIEKNDTPYLRLGYKNIYLDFSCYRLC